MIPLNTPVPNPDQPGPRLRLLITDDNPEVLSDLRQLLELSGNVEILGTATNGQEAIRMAEECRPDVVVIDQEMPVMDGFEATRQIKQRKLARRVVILSMYAGVEEMERAMSSGADDFVIKGASLETLLDAIMGQKGASSETMKGSENECQL